MGKREQKFVLLLEGSKSSSKTYKTQSGIFRRQTRSTRGDEWDIRGRGLSPRGKIPFWKVCQDAPVGTDDTFRRKTLDKSRVDYNSRQSWKTAFKIILFREALRVYRSGNDGKAHISPNPARRVEQDARQSKRIACKQMQDIT